MFEKKLCRTCLKEKDVDTQFIDIFDAHNASGELIGSLLIDCTDIDVSILKFSAQNMLKLFFNFSYSWTIKCQTLYAKCATIN
jgi:hypothetical protein